MSNKKITRKRLKQLLHYFPDTGKLRWLVSPSRGVKAGAIAGCTGRDGRNRISVEGRDYLSYRLAFLLVTGAWPVDQIDHINGDRSDDKGENK